MATDITGHHSGFLTRYQATAVLVRFCHHLVIFNSQVQSLMSFQNQAQSQTHLHQFCSSPVQRSQRSPFLPKFLSINIITQLPAVTLQVTEMDSEQKNIDGFCFYFRQVITGIRQSWGPGGDRIMGLGCLCDEALFLLECWRDEKTWNNILGERLKWRLRPLKCIYQINHMFKTRD